MLFKNTMKTVKYPHLLNIFLTFLLLVLTVLNSAFAIDSLTDSYNEPAPVSLKTLTSKIKDTEAKSDLNEEAKSRLLQLYRKTIQDLDKIQSNNVATQGFILSKNSNHEEAIRIRKILEKRKAKAERVTTDIISAQIPFVEMEQYLFTENANLAAVRAKLSDLQQQLALAAARPNVIRPQLIAIRHNQEDTTSQLLRPIAENEQALFTEATHWMLGTKRLALRAEIGMLDQELLSLPMRIELLEAGRDKYSFSVEQLTERVSSAQKAVNQHRQAEAEQAKAIAEKIQIELKGKHLLIQQLADQNSALSDELSQLTTELERVTSANNTAKKDNDRIKIQFQNVRMKFDIGGFGRVLGQVLIEQQRQLPESGLFEKRVIARTNRISEIGLQQLKYSEQYKQLQNLPDYLNQLISTDTLAKQDIQQIKSNLEKLAVSQRDTIKGLITLNNAYLQALSDSEFSDRALLKTVQNYKEFIAKRLLWLRSGHLPDFDTLNEMPSQLAGFISPIHWRGVFIAFENQTMDSPTLLLSLIIVVILIWKTKSMRSLLKETGKNVGRLSKDSIAYTFQALVLTLLLAASWPLLLAIFAWQLSISTDATLLTSVISYALFRVSLRFYGLRVIRVFCEPNGVAIAHFHMPKATIQKIHRQLSWLMAIFLPSAFLFIVMFRFDLAISTGDAGRFVVTAALLSLAVFFYRTTESKHNPLSLNQEQNTDNSIVHRRCWWQLLLVAIPLILAVFTVIGYIYTVSFMTPKFINTLWFILTLIVVKKIVLRWLLLSQRRLAWQAALEERAVARAKREAELSGEHGIETEAGEVEPDIDFVALSDESRHLLNVVLVLLGILGFAMIWADVLPAFGLLNEITLWNHTSLISGEQQLIPVTLLDLGRAFMIAFTTIAAAKYLPSLLEIIMLQQTTMTAGSRYTVTTITNYLIVATGMLMFFNILGVDWSKLQWLVAALGVGIGFGLQEIVANFISGLIILFERPIRIGDTVTIGDNDGVVVRIRIRATTIRNWDRKELLVPNKEFITGQLINWTLSDPMTRIVIPVGLAYGGDVELAIKLMMEAAEENTDVMLDPVPNVIFDQFGDNALSLKLRCFIPDTSYRLSIMTALHKTINQKFNEAGLVIAFPQQDVHLNTHAPLDIRIQHDSHKLA